MRLAARGIGSGANNQICTVPRGCCSSVWSSRTLARHALMASGNPRSLAWLFPGDENLQPDLSLVARVRLFKAAVGRGTGTMSTLAFEALRHALYRLSKPELASAGTGAWLRQSTRRIG